MKRLLNHLFSHISSESFLFSVVLLGSLTFIVWSNIIYQEVLIVHRKLIVGCLESLFTSSLMAYVVSLFRGGWKRSIRIVVVFVCAVWLLFETFLLLRFNTLYSTSIASSVFKTNPIEAKEMVGLFFRLSNFIPVLLIVLSIYFLAYCLTIGLKKIMQSLYFDCIILFLLICGIPATILNLNTNFPRYYQSSFLLRALTSSWVAHRSINYIGNLNQIQRRIDFVVSNDTLSLSNVVLIIGESLNKNYMHAYGYHLSNTPKLDSLIREGRVVKYTDVTSCASYTNAAVSRMLTLYNLVNKGQWYEYPALPLILRRAGYDTFWLSSQEKMGENADEIASLVSLFDGTKYVGAESADLAVSCYDESVLPYLRVAKEKPLFQVVHLMGSHYNYSQRYPHSFYKFDYEDIEEKYTKSEKTDLVNYVNSIYYNDYVVSKIFEHYNNSDAIVFYVPDHGESIYELDGKIGHGTGLQTKGTFSIPMFAWMSDKFMQDHPAEAKSVRLSSTKPFTTDLLAQTLIDLMGIRTNYDRTVLALFSNEYQPEEAIKRKEIIFSPNFDK